MNKRKGFLTKVLLALAITVVLISGTMIAKFSIVKKIDEDAIRQEFVELLKNKNKLIVDYTKQKFDVAYHVEDIKPLLPLLEKCTKYLKANKESESSVKMFFAMEMLAMSDDSFEGIFEERVLNSLGKPGQKFSEVVAPVSDYFTGSFLYFITPTLFTRLKAPALRRQLVNTKQANSFISIYQDDEKKRNAFYTCTMLDLQLGTLGMDSLSRNYSKKLANIMSQDNISDAMNLLFHN